MSHIESSKADHCNDHLDRLLAPAAAEIPWWVSLCRNVFDLIRPERLQPLDITSTPVPVQGIWGLYAKSPVSRYISAAVHCAVFALLMVTFSHDAPPPKVTRAIALIDPNLKPWVAPPKPKQAGGGGGGGAREIAPVSKGQAPKTAMKQFVPPMIAKQEPRLAITPTIVAPPDAVLPQSTAPAWGDPLAKLTNFSNGPGSGAGMGDGQAGGIGNGKGRGFGPGDGGGIGGGVYGVGGGVTRPVLIYQVMPEFSEEARKAKHSGIVTLAAIIDTGGKARDIRVVKSVGMGLDEKAIEAVTQWKFRPGMKDGQAVNVRMTVLVTFHLL